MLLVHGLKSLSSEIAIVALLGLAPPQIVRNVFLLFLAVSEVFFEALF